jgi:hypothetical protein
VSAALSRFFLGRVREDTVGGSIGRGPNVKRAQALTIRKDMTVALSASIGGPIAGKDEGIERGRPSLRPYGSRIPSPDMT